MNCYMVRDGEERFFYAAPTPEAARALHAEPLCLDEQDCLFAVCHLDDEEMKSYKIVDEDEDGGESCTRTLFDVFMDEGKEPGQIASSVW